MIACVVIPCFAAAVEQRDNAALVGLPLVLTNGPTPRKVYAVSNEAATQGVQPGMTVRQAQILCPQGKHIITDPLRYERAFGEVVTVLNDFSRRIELDFGRPNTTRKRTTKPRPTFPSDDQLAAVCYVDLETKHLPLAQDLAQRMAQALREQTRLTAAIGVAKGKFPARMAAAAVKADELRVIPSDQEAAFLAPLPVTLLPLDEDMIRRLRLLGIDTLGQLASLPPNAVANQFGMQGYRSRQLAAGRDNQPLVPYHPKAAEHVIRQLDGAIADRLVLEAVLHDVADELAACLHAKASMGRELNLVVHLDNSKIHEKRVALRQPVASASHIAEILSQLLGQIAVDGGVVRVEATVADLVQAVGKQLDLFIHEAGQERLLRNALRDAIARYGAECFHWIALADPQARLPGRRFTLRKVDEA